MIYLVAALVVGLVLTNYGWLWALVKLNDMWQDKQSEMMDRLNVALNKPPMPVGRYNSKVKPGEKAPNEMKPRNIEEQLFDPEWDAVGKIDPSFIDRARSIKKKENG